MQSTLRSLIGLTFLLVAGMDPALAMDASATEETNCLMACDANQENCQAAAHGAAGKHGPLAPARETRMSQSLRASANFSQINRSVPKERLRQ